MSLEWHSLSLPSFLRFCSKRTDLDTASLSLSLAWVMWKHIEPSSAIGQMSCVGECDYCLALPLSFCFFFSLSRLVSSRVKASHPLPPLSVIPRPFSPILSHRRHEKKQQKNKVPPCLPLFLVSCSLSPSLFLSRCLSAPVVQFVSLSLVFLSNLCHVNVRGCKRRSEIEYNITQNN